MWLILADLFKTIFSILFIKTVLTGNTGTWGHSLVPLHANVMWKTIKNHWILTDADEFFKQMLHVFLVLYTLLQCVSVCFWFFSSAFLCLACSSFCCLEFCAPSEVAGWFLHLHSRVFVVAYSYLIPCSSVISVPALLCSVISCFTSWITDVLSEMEKGGESLDLKVTSDNLEVYNFYIRSSEALLHSSCSELQITSV